MEKTFKNLKKISKICLFSEFWQKIMERSKNLKKKHQKVVFFGVLIKINKKKSFKMSFLLLKKHENLTKTIKKGKIFRNLDEK